MNRYIISKGKIVSGKVREKRDLERNQANEKLRKNVRRAVKNVVVPAALEEKIWDLIRTRA